jgi:hypothetical protein
VRGSFPVFQNGVNRKYAAIAPDLSSEEVEKAFRAIYPPDKQVLGIAALEIIAVDESKV